MKTFVTIISFFVCSGLCCAQSLDAHRWENRVVIIKSSGDSTTEPYKEQFGMLEADPTRMEERKLILYLIVEDSYGIWRPGSEKTIWKPLSNELTKKLDPKKEFQVILLGLDGGVKLHREAVISKEELFRIIDAMPMRISELRGKKG